MKWEEEEEQEEGAACVEEVCAWGGSVIGGLGGCREISEDVQMKDASEKMR